MAGSILSIAVFGTKLALSLFAFGENTVTARDQINSIASEISLFSQVLKQLDDLLKKDGAMCSDDFMEVVNVILGRCRSVFGEIKEVIGEELEANRGPRGGRSAVTERVKWPFKKGKCKQLKATLRSMKSTLILMLQTITLAQMVSNRRETVGSAEDIEQGYSTTESLIKTTCVARDRLKELEEEYSPQGQSSTNLTVSQQLSDAVPLVASNVVPVNSGSRLVSNRGSFSGQNLAPVRPEAVTAGVLLNRWTTLKTRSTTSSASSEDNNRGTGTEFPPPKASRGHREHRESYFPSTPPSDVEPNSQRRRRGKGSGATGRTSFDGDAFRESRQREFKRRPSHYAESPSTPRGVGAQQRKWVGSDTDINGWPLEGSDSDQSSSWEEPRHETQGRKVSCFEAFRKVGGDITWLIRRQRDDNSIWMEMYLGPKKFFEYPTFQGSFVGHATFIDRLWIEDHVLQNLGYRQDSILISNSLQLLAAGQIPGAAPLHHSQRSMNMGLSPPPPPPPFPAPAPAPNPCSFNSNDIGLPGCISGPRSNAPGIRYSKIPKILSFAEVEQIVMLSDKSDVRYWIPRREGRRVFSFRDPPPPPPPPATPFRPNSHPENPKPLQNPSLQHPFPSSPVSSPRKPREPQSSSSGQGGSSPNSRQRRGSHSTNTGEARATPPYVVRIPSPQPSFIPSSMESPQQPLSHIQEDTQPSMRQRRSSHSKRSGQIPPQSPKHRREKGTWF